VSGMLGQLVDTARKVCSAISTHMQVCGVVFGCVGLRVRVEGLGQDSCHVGDAFAIWWTLRGRSAARSAHTCRWVYAAVL
jgi:hypothetical protein